MYLQNFMPCQLVPSMKWPIVCFMLQPSPSFYCFLPLLLLVKIIITITICRLYFAQFFQHYLSLEYIEAPAFALSLLANQSLIESIPLLFS